jgi:predicted amidohydrolase YtcJ
MAIPVLKNDLLVRGRIWTGDKGNPFAEAFLVRDGKFGAVGCFRDIRALAAARETEFLDTGDDLVIPGMSDSHIHLTAVAKQDLYVNLAGARSFQAVLEMIRERAHERPGEAWIRGVNYNEEAWSEPKRPTRQHLDALGIDSPVIISRYCGHVHVADTKALQAAGLWDSTDPNVVRDGQGLPTGVLNEGAAGGIVAEIARMCETPERIRTLIGKTCIRLSSLGITAVHACDAPSYALGEDLRAFQDLEEGGKLPLRVFCYHDALPNYSFRSGFGSARVSFGGFKVFCDGSIGGRTAALSSPYSDDPATSGQLNHTDEELYEQVRQAHRREIQVQIHVIGDRAIEQALRIVERVIHEEGEPKRPYRFNHSTYCPEPLVQKIGDLGIVVDAQPVQPFRNRLMAPARLGRERLPFSYAYRRFVDAGILVTGSSDGPIEDLNPWAGIWAAVNRTDEAGKPMSYSPPEDRLSLDEALRMYTTNPWIALGRGNEFGRILSGFGADFTVLDCDPFKLPPGNLRNVRHRCTFVEGNPTWGEI